jgi:hypothetical protein
MTPDKDGSQLSEAAAPEDDDQDDDDQDDVDEYADERLPLSLPHP